MKAIVFEDIWFCKNTCKETTTPYYYYYDGGGIGENLLEKYANNKRLEYGLSLKKENDLLRILGVSVNNVYNGLTYNDFVVELREFIVGEEGNLQVYITSPFEIINKIFSSEVFVGTNKINANIVTEIRDDGHTLLTLSYNENHQFTSLANLIPNSTDNMSAIINLRFTVFFN